MKRHLSLLTSSVIIFFVFQSSAVLAIERADEIRSEMWNSANKNFQTTEIPKKWLGKSAVILAQLNRYEYRKPAILNLLRYNEYNHYRIKLLDKNAITKYAEMSYYNNRTDNNTGETINVFVGFKVVKPNGKEIIVDLTSAVTMEKEMKGSDQSYSKIAIPGLEIGDILDYYICEETTRMNSSSIYFFDPVIYHLPREYPVLSHKLQFRAERRCYINLQSLNGAPEMKLEQDNTNEETYYTLDVSDIEPVEDQRWFYPYRDLPSIKFRAAYASSKAMRNYAVLLGEPGVVKNSVTKNELEVLVAFRMNNMTSVAAPGLVSFAKKKLKGVKDPLEVARQAYYYHRNNQFNYSEGAVVEGNAMPEVQEVQFIQDMRNFFVKMKINYDIILAVPKHISSIDNILMENEIEWLIRVKDGDRELFLSPFDLNTVPGEIPVMVEGIDAYALGGNEKIWKIRPIKIPAMPADHHRSLWNVKVDLTDLSKAKLAVKKTLTGRNKLADQYSIMDIYDVEPEERANPNYKMTESFQGYSIFKKKYLALKDAYIQSRDKYKQEVLKESVEGSFDLKALNPGGLVIEKTGRYHTDPALVYSYTFETEDLVKKTGSNYLIEAGKLIDKQPKIETEEIERKNNIYFDNQRSYAFKIEIELPKGYTVQGLDKFNIKIENKLGGFSSSAKEVGGKIIIETHKHYDVTYVPKEQWSQLVTFLNAASNFTEQKILLKKK